MPFPAHVETPRLVATRPTPADIDALVALIGDPRIPADMYPAAFRAPDRARASIDTMVRQWADHGWGIWAVRERATERLVGRVGLVATDIGEGPAVEVGWFVHYDVQGRGYATEVAREAVRHGFEDLGLDEIVSYTLPTNLASQAVMRKLGMVQSGRIERFGVPHVLCRLEAPRPP